MTASDIVDRFGGTSELARLFPLKISTVHSWRSTNSIPEWRRSRLLEIAMELGVQLSTTDFPSPDERVRRAA